MIYQHLPTISEKMNTLEDILRKFIGCFEVYPLYNCLGKFSFPSPMSNSISLPGRFSGWSWSGGGHLSTIPGHPSCFGTPISKLKPIHLLHVLPSYIGHPGHLHLPNVNEYISISTLSLLIDKSRGLQAPVPVPGACNKMEIGTFPRYLASQDGFFAILALFQMVVWFFCLEASFCKCLNSCLSSTFILSTVVRHWAMFHLQVILFLILPMQLQSQ